MSNPHEILRKTTDVCIYVSELMPEIVPSTPGDKVLFVDIIEANLAYPESDLYNYFTEMKEAEKRMHADPQAKELFEQMHRLVKAFLAFAFQLSIAGRKSNEANAIEA